VCPAECRVCGEATKDSACQSAAATDVAGEPRLSPGRKTNNGADRVGGKTKREHCANWKSVHETCLRRSDDRTFGQRRPTVFHPIFRYDVNRRTLLHREPLRLFAVLRRSAHGFQSRTSNRAPGAEVQNRSCSIKWAAKQGNGQPLERCFS
jgi:hypothetical protein